MKPLNGEKTHPLSNYARRALRELVDGPRPTQLINPGVVDRLQRGQFIEIVPLPSPFKTHKGANINFARLTVLGIDEAMKGANP
jgi:hypothetical protein